jgi:hypothetical protein
MTRATLPPVHLTRESHFISAGYKRVACHIGRHAQPRIIQICWPKEIVSERAIRLCDELNKHRLSQPTVPLASPTRHHGIWTRHTGTVKSLSTFLLGVMRNEDGVRRTERARKKALMRDHVSEGGPCSVAPRRPHDDTSEAITC